MCETLHLYGVILLLLDRRLRERLIVGCYNYKEESMLNDFDEVCALCRVTGFREGSPPPNNYPEEFFPRSPVPSEVTRTIIARLQSGDVYLATHSFPVAGVYLNVISCYARQVLVPSLEFIAMSYAKDFSHALPRVQSFMCYNDLNSQEAVVLILTEAHSSS